MFSSIRRNSRAFSLIELVIVVVIIGIIAAIAIPRMSRGATAANDNALAGNLSVLRKAVDLYQAEHSGFPTAADIVNQLTKYTDQSGTTSDTRTGAFIYGPYLRAIPPMTATKAAKKGKSGISATDGAEIGWIYDDAAGTVKANTTALELDDAGKKYSDY